MVISRSESVEVSEGDTTRTLVMVWRERIRSDTEREMKRREEEEERLADLDSPLSSE